jgi:DNA topoisomerase-3
MKRMVEALRMKCAVKPSVNISHAGSIQRGYRREEESIGIRQKFVRNVKKATLWGKSAYGCSGYKAGCDFVLPYTFC